MDDFRLRVFITAAKTLNFTKCAEQLYISQPAVSKHIGELESRYKVQLFERSGELRIIDIEGCTIRREFSFCWPEGRSDALAARFVEFARHTA